MNHVQMDFLTALPFEIGLKIYKFLPFSDAVCSSTTCTYFRHLLQLDKQTQEKVEFLQQNRQTWINSLIFDCALRGWRDVLKWLMIEKPNNQNCIRQWNWGMRGAARAGHKDLVEWFISKGAEDWNSGMHEAARGGHKDLVERFVSKGADELNRGMNRAARGGHKDLVEWFVIKGANNWNWGMYGAARGGHRDLVAWFVSKGADDWNWGLRKAAREGYRDLAE